MNIVQKLKDKLFDHVTRIESEKHDDHDWLPALFWAVLDQHQKLTDEQSSLKNALINKLEFLEKKIKKIEIFNYVLISLLLLSLIVIILK